MLGVAGHGDAPVLVALLDLAGDGDLLEALPDAAHDLVLALLGEDAHPARLAAVALRDGLEQPLGDFRLVEAEEVVLLCALLEGFAGDRAVEVVLFGDRLGDVLLL